MQSLPALLLVVAACGPGARETTDDLPAVDGGLDPDALALGCGDSTYLAATAPGADGTWGTSDDVVTTRTDTRYDSAGRLVDERNYGLGPDGAARTADDELTGWSVRAYDGTTMTIINYNGPGPDDAWLTGDDQVNDAIEVTGFVDQYSGTGVRSSAIGPDGAWFTADDQRSHRFALAPTASGFVEAWYLAGPDGEPGTADDEPEIRVTGTRDAQEVLDLSYAMPGGDGAWDTADDVVPFHGTVTCGADAAVFASARGADGTWGTSDDVVVTYSWVVDGQPCSDRCVNVID